MSAQLRTLASCMVVIGLGLALPISLAGCQDEHEHHNGHMGTGDHTGDRDAQPAQTAASPYVNATCPIMGSPIDPAKVTPDLVRTFEGRKVAFCCSSCPPAWDKLSDEQKRQKLSAAMSR